MASASVSGSVTSSPMIVDTNHVNSNNMIRSAISSGGSLASTNSQFISPSTPSARTTLSNNHFTSANTSLHMNIPTHANVNVQANAQANANTSQSISNQNKTTAPLVLTENEKLLVREKMKAMLPMARKLDVQLNSLISNKKMELDSPIFGKLSALKGSWIEHYHSISKGIFYLNPSMTEMLQNNLVKCFQFVETLLASTPSVPAGPTSSTPSSTSGTPTPQSINIPTSVGNVVNVGNVGITGNAGITGNTNQKKEIGIHILGNHGGTIPTESDIKDGFKYAIEQDKELKRITGSAYSTIVAGMTIKRHDWVSELLQYGIPMDTLQPYETEQEQEVVDDEENELQDFEFLFGKQDLENLQTELESPQNFTENSKEELTLKTQISSLQSIGYSIQIIKDQDPHTILMIESPTKDVVLVLELNQDIILKRLNLKGNFIHEIGNFNSLYTLLRNKGRGVDSNLLQNPASIV